MKRRGRWHGDAVRLAGAAAPGAAVTGAAPGERRHMALQDDCPYLFRVVEGEPPTKGAGSAVLVSDRVSHGYALTCWHNLDFHFLKAAEWQPPEGWTPGPGAEEYLIELPDTVRVRPRTARQLEAPAGRRVQLVASWSNPRQDVAVLRLDRRTIDDFELKPAPICLEKDLVGPGAPVVVRGFERPWAVAKLERFLGRIPRSTSPFVQDRIRELRCTQDLFRVDLEHVWERGLSGGGVFHEPLGALIGIAGKAAGDLHRGYGLATSLNVVARSWPRMGEYCPEVKVPAGRDLQVLGADWRPYLETLKQENLYVEIRGMGARVAERMELQQVYTRLRGRGGLPGSRRAGGGEAGEDRGECSLEEALAEHPHVVLVGDPGSGKTTFLSFVAQSLARAWLDGDTIALGRVGLTGVPPFPVLVRLGDLAGYLRKEGQAASPASPEPFYSFLDEVLGGRQAFGLPRSYLRERVLAGGACLLLDGLDEVPGEDMREQVRGILERVVGDGRQVGNRHVVTCRTRAYEGKAQLGGDFATFHLAPFRRAEVEQFVHGWCQALYRLGGEAADGTAGAAAIAGARRYEGELLAAIDAHPHITPLTGNPLMLTVVAVVHWSQKRLPEQRAELYEKAVEWLLGSRRRASEHPEALRRECLESVALRMVEDEAGVRRTLGVAEAAEVVKPILRVDGRRAIEFLEDEALHSGLLVSRSDLAGELEFWHLTFEEYLAASRIACLALEGDYWPRVRSHLHDASWREVILLLAGCLRRVGLKPATGLIRRILDHDPGLVGRARAVGLVGLLLRDIRPYGGSPEVGTGYEEALGGTLAIFEPGGPVVDERTRVEVGEALGQAGDPRLAEPAKLWVRIPGGSFLMGAQKDRPGGEGYDAEAFDAEGPPHRVTVAAFELYRYPVTVGQYGEFVKDGGYVKGDCWSDEGWAWRQGSEGASEPGSWKEQVRHPNRPVVEVCWHEAEAYCRWLRARREWGRGARLPSEAEWEYAARGSGGRRYPWGDEAPDERHANFDGRVGALTPVGIYPLGGTPEGVQDLAGNVLEWCRDARHDSYAGAPGDGSARGGEGAGASRRVYRGGCWRGDAWCCRAAYRDGFSPSYRNDYLGFRPARSLR